VASDFAMMEQCVKKTVGAQTATCGIVPVPPNNGAPGGDALYIHCDFQPNTLGIPREGEVAAAAEECRRLASAVVVLARDAVGRHHNLVWFAVHLHVWDDEGRLLLYAVGVRVDALSCSKPVTPDELGRILTYETSHWDAMLPFLHSRL
jgi:hypothetical protein